MKWFRRHIVEHLPAHFFWLILGALFLLVAGTTPEDMLAKGLEHLPSTLSVANATLLFRVAMGLVGLAVLAIALWPRRRRSTTQPVDMTSRDAIHYLAQESRWAAGMDDVMALLKAAEEFERAARNGEITVRARPQWSGKYETLDRTFWMTNGLDVTRHLDYQVELHTQPKEIMRDAQVYVDPLVERAAVERVWPRRGR